MWFCSGSSTVCCLWNANPLNLLIGIFCLYHPVFNAMFLAKRLMLVQLLDGSALSPSCGLRPSIFNILFFLSNPGCRGLLEPIPAVLA